jgi:outer membrane scaffolding protein for murein synthesis (MipA/OmpV family)
LTEKFRSISPYLSIEGSYTFTKGWRVVGTIQYSYSRTHTIVKPLVDDKSHSEGFSYSAMIEHDLTQQWSVNLGGAYNLSLTKEKHGMRIWGFKLGIARWF